MRHQQNQKVCFVNTIPSSQTRLRLHPATMGMPSSPIDQEFELSNTITITSCNKRDTVITKRSRVCFVKHDFVTYNDTNRHCFHIQHERIQRHYASLLSKSKRKNTMTPRVIAFTIKTKEYYDTTRHCFHNQNERIQ